MAEHNTDPTDPGKAMRDLSKARVARLPKDAVKKDVADVKSELRKAVSPKGALAKLIDDWTCT